MNPKNSAPFLDKFEKKVKETAENYRMLSQGDRVLVAVSGGPDSITLLHVLKTLSPFFQIDLAVFHLNHLIREKAEEEAQFVEEIAQQLGLESFIYTQDVPAYANEKKLSLEEAGREVRHSLAQKVADEHGFSKIAYGHQADDLVETFFIRLLRGTSLEGLKSIPPVRGRLIRPLIERTREEVMAYLSRKNIPYQTDETNLDSSNLRSKVRYYLVPYFLSYNPNFREHLLKLIEIIRSEDEYIQKSLQETLKKTVKLEDDTVVIASQNRQLPSPLLKRLLKNALYTLPELSSKLESKHLESLERLLKNPKQGFQISLPLNYTAWIEENNLLVGKAKKLTTKPLEPLILSIPGSVKCWNTGLTIKATLSKKDEVHVNKAPKQVAYLDAAKLQFPLKVRTWLPGDRFKPLGLSGTKKLQDFFVDLKVPKRLRHATPIIESGGEIVWVAGYRIDERFKVTEKTQSILSLELLHEEEG
jgi:tRNA(Ile)-lysidine synthase